VRDAILTGLAWLYAGALCMYVLWMLWDWPRPWWLQVINTLALWLFGPCLVLPLTWIFVHALAYWLANGLMIGVFTAYFLHPMFVRRKACPAGDDPVRVMTANLLKYNLRADEVVATIRAADADIVALQELKLEHTTAIERDLAHLYPYRALHPGQASEGMGLLSRRPWDAFALHVGEPGGNYTQVAHLRLGGHATWVVNIHTRIPQARECKLAGLSMLCGLDTRGRRADVAQIVQRVEALPGNAIILGDWNMTEECAEYRLIPPYWHDAYREAAHGPGLTFPVGVSFFGLRTPWPLFRLDYLFYRGDWCALRARTGRMPGSDHRYLLVELG
jgi:vancomycin resistance protein VanJ